MSRRHSRRVAAAGQYFVRPYEGNGWYVQSVKAGDTDITDRLFDLQTDATILVTYTDRATKVSGTVKDARGAASTTATVLAVSRRSHAMVGLRRLAAELQEHAWHRPAVCSRSSTCRLVSTTSSPSTAEDAEDWQDPQKLEALARRATTLTVAAGRHGEDARSRGGDDPMNGHARRTLAIVDRPSRSAPSRSRRPLDFAHGRQVRENAAPPTGTASIAGTVFVDGAAKQPARRVRVTLTDLSGATTGQTTTTDDSGAFAFRALPAGRFELQAFKTGYLKGSYGAAQTQSPRHADRRQGRRDDRQPHDDDRARRRHHRRRPRSARPAAAGTRRPRAQVRLQRRDRRAHARRAEQRQRGDDRRSRRVPRVRPAAGRVSRRRQPAARPIRRTGRGRHPAVDVRRSAARAAGRAIRFDVSRAVRAARLALVASRARELRAGVSSRRHRSSARRRPCRSA